MGDIYYEDLIENTVREAERALAHLSVQPVALSSHLEKQESRSLPEILSNYNELRACFRGTEYDWFFAD